MPLSLTRQVVCMPSPHHKKRNVFFLAGIFLVVLAIAFSLVFSRTPSDIAREASVRISERSVLGAELLPLVVKQKPDSVFRKYWKYYSAERLAIYLFRNDSLVAWNNSQLPFRTTIASFTASSGFVTLASGYYYYRTEKQEKATALALVQLKPKYELQNRYLSNSFAPWLDIPAEIDLSPAKGTFNVAADGKFLFSLVTAEARYYSRTVDDVCFIVFIVGLLCLLTGALLLVRTAALRVFGPVIGAILVVRLFMIIFGGPEFFYRTTLFDVRIFGNAQSYFDGYLGDMLINSILLLFFAAAVFFVPEQERIRNNKWFACISGFFLLITALQFNLNLVSLVFNSTLSFNFLDFTSITMPAVAGLLCLALHCLAIFQLLRTYLLCFNDRIRLTALGGLIVLMCLALFLLPPHSQVIGYIWPLLMALPLYLAVHVRKIGNTTAVGVHLLVMSAITSAMLSENLAKNQTQDLEVLSLKLGERQDPVLENEYEEIPARLASDQSLRVLLQILPSTADAITDLLGEKYFGGYFKRYTLSFSLFDANCNPLLPTADPLLQNEGYFLDQVRYHSDSTSVNGLYFVSSFRENARYIATVNLSDYRLYVLMQPKQFEELGSFPDLLLDESQQKHEILKGFSYAVYRSGHNTSRFGGLSYPPFLPDSALLQTSEPDYEHWYFSPDDFTSIVISRPVRTLGYFFTFNSYMLLLFSVVGYLIFLIHALVFSDTFGTSSLMRRIQTIIIVLLLLAMSAVGITSGRLVQQQFAAENKKQLREKTDIIYTDLVALYSPKQLFEPVNRDAVNIKLNDYARLFNTDVSLFDARGFLYATSQPRLYSLGLSAGYAHPRALYKLSANLSASETINERAGNLSYLSLYTAIYDKDSNTPAGYINLPYFARQNDLVTELSGIISALVNVYVILFLVSIAAGLVLAGYITRPLRLIQQQIARISLGKTNEKIQWQGRDELGHLITEYNQMLVKLEESATLLAQSERESAWREMAKQVAHEIKNPLTPMKLNLQYLQHLMKSDAPDFRDKFEKASAGIIEQIDALANIANEFSHFAKLPVSQVETINIAEVIRSSVHIFENRDKITFRNRVPEDEILVKGDRDQCLRVFNNLFTNALQAVQDTEEPWIEIGRQLNGDSVIIQVRDNGVGIDEELKPRIFTPNFTTKTAGSGLGLAMVKNIIEGFGGRIWFESEKGLGTIFYIEFRK